jgi:hypothetical protein
MASYIAAADAVHKEAMERGMRVELISQSWRIALCH